jgi:signal peptidase I
MLGDNRPISDDSRLWVHKYVARSAIVGEANFVLYPLDKLGAISQSLSSPANNG